jgi:RimJ/RimL family protein N-acetyltransferase
MLPLRFVRPSVALAASFAVMRDAFVAAGEDPWSGQDQEIAHRDPVAYATALCDWSDGRNLPPNRTPFDAFWIVRGDVVVGQCGIRHPLTPKLAAFGGHVGYDVHPAYRNQGIATFALREALNVLAGKGVAEALVTCAEDNVASIRVIEKCGGRRIADSTRRRYRVPTGLDAEAEADIVIRPVVDDDFALLCAWFGDSEFVTWWGGTPKTPAEVREKYLGRYDPEQRQHVRSNIIAYRREPIGYIQAWNQNATTVGIDVVMIPGMQNRGIGTKAVRLFAERLASEGWHHIGLDPATENARAIRAFEKAGFRITERAIEPGHLWMEFVDHPISPRALHIRRAVSDDAAAACGVIRASITELCGLDHGNDARYLQAWLSNKTPENVRRWIEQSHVVVAVADREIVGVAAMRSDGKITLNYVAPSARFQGVSKALMRQIEETATALGLEACTLETTRTALGFYESLGFQKSPERYILPLTGTIAQVLVKRLPDSA